MEDPAKKGRKGSFTDDDFILALEKTHRSIFAALLLIPPGVEYMICFTSSFVLRACDPEAKFHKQCLDFLRWRYATRGVITRDCDLIFAEDPPDSLARCFRHWNRDVAFTIDWRKANNYIGNQWHWVKTHGLKHHEVIDKIPVQPFEDVIWVKHHLLSNDLKHLEDAKYLSNL